MVQRPSDNPQELYQAAQRRLENLADEGREAGIDPLEPIDILWGWGEIAAALRVSEGTAKAYYDHEGLPVIIRRGKTPQTTKAALKVWAEGSDLQGDGQKHDGPNQP